MNNILKKSLLSFYIYSFSELTQYYYNKSYNLNDSYKRVFFGTFVDSILLRKYHKFIDTKTKNVLLKTTSEFIFVSPFTTSSFLFINNNFSLQNWYKIYTDDLLFWSINSTISYKFFRYNYRYLYISCCSYFWSNYRIFYFSD